MRLEHERADQRKVLGDCDFHIGMRQAVCTGSDGHCRLRLKILHILHRQLERRIVRSLISQVRIRCKESGRTRAIRNDLSVVKNARKIDRCDENRQQKWQNESQLDGSYRPAQSRAALSATISCSIVIGHNWGPILCAYHVYQVSDSARSSSRSNAQRVPTGVWNGRDPASRY